MTLMTLAGIKIPPMHKWLELVSSYRMGKMIGFRCTDILEVKKRP